MSLEPDEIGHWTEVKLQIIKKYAKAYSMILAKYKFDYIYIDGFAGAGEHISKETGLIIQGSPCVVLDIEPRFKEYHFIDTNNAKISALKDIVGNRQNVFIHEANCNEILPKQILPTVRWGDKRRGFCLLDPYGLHLSWDVIQQAGEMRTIDVLINYPAMDINRNVLWKDLDKILPKNVSRMDAFWGDTSWKEVAYDKNWNLLSLPLKIPNAVRIIREKFAERLIKVAKFKYIASPLPMRNSKGNIVYYLFFASNNETAVKIMNNIFKNTR